MLEWARDWLEADKGDPGIVWVEHVPFGMKLSELSGIRYFGAGDHVEILTHTGPMIASIRAHGEGRNLQRYRRCLVIAPPDMGATWEQLLGRNHRPGQKADEVEWEVCLQAPELWASFKNALIDAKYIQETQGKNQKLLLSPPALDEVSMRELEADDVNHWKGD